MFAYVCTIARLQARKLDPLQGARLLYVLVNLCHVDDEYYMKVPRAEIGISISAQGSNHQLSGPSIYLSFQGRALGGESCFVLHGGVQDISQVLHLLVQLSLCCRQLACQLISPVQA